MSELTDDQRKLLKPHAEHFYMMASYVRECSDDEQEELLEAAKAHTPTNCSWASYTAAQFLKDEIVTLRCVRRRLVEAASVNADQ